MISIHDDAGLESLRRQARLEPHLLRRVRAAFYKKAEPAQAALERLPESARSLFEANVAFHSLELHDRLDSQKDGATKLLFRTRGGPLLETVLLRIASGRTSLCLSSQIGCAARCVFCATGQMGITKNLTHDEILDQVVQANQQLRTEGRSIRNVVFMGMGEPFHNEAEVFRALEILQATDGFNLSPAKILVSTVGIPEGMIRCAERYPQVGMAFSLHAARQEVRERLIPLARRHPLAELRKTLIRVAGLLQRPLMIEYVMLEGQNDSAQDLQELIDYLRDLPVHINLIPWNSFQQASELTGTSPEKVRRFAAALRAAGFVVTIRYSLGSDIEAACGQLVRRAAASPLQSIS